MLQRALTTSSPLGFSTTPLLRGALYHYLNKTAISPRSPLSVNSSFFGKDNLKAKSPTPSSNNNKVSPLNIQHSPKKTSYTPEVIPTQSILRSNLPSESSPLRVYSPSNLQKFNSFPAKRKAMPNVTFDLGQNADKRTLTRSQTVKTEVRSQNHQDMYQEVVQWRTVGGQMSQSYKELNNKFKDFIQNKEQDKVNIESLVKEVQDLESQLQKARENSARSSSSTSESQNLSTLRETVEQAKKEREYIREALESLKNENAELKKSVADITKSQSDADYYQKLAESRLKERSTLAEEIITLRTKLDRSHSNYLRVQRSRTMASESGRETPEVKSRGSSLKKNKKSETGSAKKEVKWKDELEEDSAKLSPNRRI